MTYYQMVLELMDKMNWPTTNATKLAKSKRLVNEAKDWFVLSGNWATRMKIDTFETVDGTATYSPFPDLDKMMFIRQTDTPQMLRIIKAKTFLQLVPDPSTENPPEFYYPYGINSSGWQTFGLYPVPADAYTMYCAYLMRVHDRDFKDYDTGYITTLANGGTAVTLSGSDLPANVVGKYFKVRDDGNWYHISARGSDTTLTLSEAYQGTAISGGGTTDTFIIGDLYMGLKEPWYSAILQRAIMLATQYDQQYMELFTASRYALKDEMEKIKADNKVETDRIGVLKPEDFNTQTQFVHLPWKDASY